MYLYLEPYVYVNSTSKEVLFYNTLSNDFYLIQKSSIGLNKIPDNNCRLIEICQTEFNKCEKIINNLREKFMLDYFDEDIEKLPLISSPSINFSTGIKFKDFIKKRTLNDVISQISDVNFFINDACKNDCNICHQAFKQFNFCTKSNENRYLDVEIIKEILLCLKNAPLNNIKILGGNIFLHPQITQIIDLCNNLECNYSIYLNYDNIGSLPEYIEIIKGEINILYSEPPSKEDIINTLDICKLKTFILNIIVESIDDYNTVKELNESINDIDMNVLPFYNNANLLFFKEYIFLNNNDLNQLNINYKDILINELINKNHYL